MNYDAFIDTLNKILTILAVCLGSFILGMFYISQAKFNCHIPLFDWILVGTVWVTEIVRLVFMVFNTEE